MAVYAYSATGADGQQVAPIRGTITADSPRQARDQLRARGLTIREVVEQKPVQPQSILQQYRMSRQKGNVTGLLQEMATLLTAGIPLLEALDTISRQHGGSFQKCILMLREQVASGNGLAEAMASQPILFDELCRNIVEVGENAGTLDVALARLVEFRRKTAGLKNRVTTALLYPCIVLTMGLGVSLFLMTYVVPNLLGVLLDSGKELPFATVVIKGMSDFLRAWWWALLGGGVVTAGGIAAILRTEPGRERWHRLQLRIPLLGDLIRKQAIARMSMVMATLLRSDVMFVRAVRIAQRTVNNLVLRNALVECENAVYAGRDIAAALEHTRAFPPLVIQVFAVGQASGRLEEMLENLAADYDTQVDIASGRFTALLEPILMVLLAISVGFIAFATILPILEAGDVL